MTVSLGVALGGGGARGLAHIVLLEVLDELGIVPARIAGCSMGAVVGAAYAGGLTGREIRGHALRVLRNRRVLLGRALEARIGRFSDLFTRGLVNPVLIDAEQLLPLFWPEGLPGSFAGLRVPLTVIATDFDARREVAIEDGPLLGAVAASIAIPGLAQPVQREGLRLIDGGAVNPLPYDRLHGRADRVVACDVASGGVGEPRGDHDAVGIMLGAAQIMQGALTARMLAWRTPDLLVRPPVERFRLLEFFHAARILETADTMRDALKRDLGALLDDRVTPRRAVRRDR